MGVKLPVLFTTDDAVTSEAACHQFLTEVDRVRREGMMVTTALDNDDLIAIVWYDITPPHGKPCTVREIQVHTPHVWAYAIGDTATAERDLKLLQSDRDVHVPEGIQHAEYHTTWETKR